jgi:hypothetical protein
MKLVILAKNELTGIRLLEHNIRKIRDKIKKNKELIKEKYKASKLAKDSKKKKTLANQLKKKKLENVSLQHKEHDLTETIKIKKKKLKS